MIKHKKYISLEFEIKLKSRKEILILRFNINSHPKKLQLHLIMCCEQIKKNINCERERLDLIEQVFLR